MPQNQIDKLTENAIIKLKETLGNTQYEPFIKKISTDYALYLQLISQSGFISPDEIEMFFIKKVEFAHNNAYASWREGTLILQDRFFDEEERNDEERRNVLFHELTHQFTNEFFFYNPIINNFWNFCSRYKEYLTPEQIDELKERFADIFNDPYYSNFYNAINSAGTPIDEVMTQYIAEILTAQSYKREKEEMQPFTSKIFIENDELKSNFATYPEFEQIFLDFLRTINGFGSIENDDELFRKWYEMLKDGSIWNRIIATYKEKGNVYELFEFLITFGALNQAKVSSFGKDKEFTGNKELLTANIISLDNQLQAMRNLDVEKEYEYVEYTRAPQEKRVFGSGKK